MARRRYATGRRAWGHDARTGDRVLLKDLVRDGHSGVPVTRESFEPRHPQEIPPDIFDPQILRRPAPDLDRPGYTVHWPTGDFTKLWTFYANPALHLLLPGTTPYIATDIANAVAVSADDANEVVSTGVVNITGTVIGFQDDRLAGFRFQNLAIPNADPIRTAWVQFTSSFAPDSTSGVACTVQIWGEDDDSAVAFTTGASDISNRTQTSASVLWTLPVSSGEDAWLENARGPNQRTPDLSDVIQEVVNRAGWSSGNDLVLIFQQISGNSAVRQVAAQDHATLAPAMLFIDHGTVDGSGRGMDSGFGPGFG